MKTTSAFDAFDWRQFERVIVLAPHLDDAVLSAAGLLLALKGHVSRLVVTIACGNPVRRNNGKRARPRKGFASPSERRKEDIRAMHDLDCDFVHLGFADCIYRRSPTTGDLIYNKAQTKFAVGSPEDRAHVEELFLVLRRLCRNMGRVLVVAPLGIGYHVDHLIAAQVALQIAGVSQLLFYEDVPYVFNPQIGAGVADGPLAALERLGCMPVRRLAVRYDVETKCRLIRYYESQLPVLFSDPGRLEDELRQRSWEEGPAEFFWRAKWLSTKGNGR